MNPLLHSIQRMDRTHLSELLAIQYFVYWLKVVPGPHCPLLKPCSESKVVNFLVGFFFDIHYSGNFIAVEGVAF